MLLDRRIQRMEWEMAESAKAAGLLERPVEDLPAGVAVDSSAEPMLDDVSRRLVGELIPLLERHAQELQVAVDRVEVRGYTSWEEGTRQLVITQCVRLPLEESLEYWDTLEAPILAWTSTLSSEAEGAFCRRISVQVTGLRDAGRV